MKTAMLTYETLPEGAVLYEAGQAIGTAPVTRTYQSDGKSDTIRTPDVTAVWPSGAKTSYFTVLPFGSDRVATINRPNGVPGLELDMENAKKFAASREQEARRQKEEAARDLARSSARCRAQQASGGPKAGIDDCK
jgi:hypothetical protein